MALKKYIIYILISFNFVALAKELTTEFIYPVNANSDIVYFLHQKGIKNLELCSLDVLTNNIVKNILPNCFPANLTLLPNKKGFSFIDQGRIRIKYFDSTEIKTISLEEPIYNISYINWLDDNTCYFSAKDGNNFNIYFLNILNNQFYCLKPDPVDHEINANFFYPQFQKNNLYIIECSIDNRYKTKRHRYKIIKVNCKNYQEAGIRFISDTDKQLLIDFATMPICFLKMISDNEGFFIEHPSLIDKNDRLLQFIFHKLYFDSNGQIYKTEELFEFNLPTHYLFGKNDERLYESILPFLPKLIGNKIFFSNSTDQDNLFVNIYSYNLDNKKIDKETFAINNEIYFSPLIIENKILYGFNLTPEKFRFYKINSLPFIELK